MLRQLQQALAQGDSAWGTLERIASADVAMAAALIRMANSAMFALVQPVKSVPQAMTVLGMQATANLLTGFLSREALQVQSPLLEHFWSSSNRRALACEHIGRQLYDMDPGLAYSFGLFCHVGMPVLLRGLPTYARTMTEALARQDRTFVETENANHRTDHAVVGAIVARTWHLPDEVAMAIRLHHDFTSLSDASFSDLVRRLVAMGLLAERLVQLYEAVDSTIDWSQYGPTCLSFLQVGESEVDLWLDVLHPSFDAVNLR